MSPYQQKVPLVGSERVEPPGARRVGPADPNERVEVSVYLRPRSTSEPDGASNKRVSHLDRVMTREEYADTFGAHPDDLAQVEAFARHNHLPEPQVSSVSVDGAKNAPSGDPLNRPDGEVMLDIEVTGAIAPGATIVVYFAPLTDQGFIDAVTTAAFDSVNKPSVISISWGWPESDWTAQALQTFNNALQAAGQVGVTVCCASGDNGASDAVGDGKAHVIFPASSPFVLACGGTRLESSNGIISSEVVWNDSDGATGGGISDVFDLPDWQQGAGVPPSINPGGRVGRGLPDVAANADPETGYRVYIDGQPFRYGGTSAAAPLWAAMIALVNQQLEEPLGYVNPLLYEQLIVEADVVDDITSGNNGGYQAAPGWDACTGLGRPDGANWLAALIY